ncbi:hypothetical protein [Methanolobus profundi]|uniref:Uncharacterized protein n=1 Tax=Methanolobus profundi TaxID=487685 RepID=A0A1I4TP02_9EURY|nr:hypothetical protein [Methanolobus profundi]SFM78419.1 hypothetical protein SAMN04488696_2370 [Methanolobus profundi]
MNRTIRIRIILILIILVNTLIPIFASAEYNESIDSHNSYLEEFRNDSHFIGYKGNLPDTIDQEWKNAIRDCWLNLTGPSYYKFDKSIKSVGSNSELLIVYLGSAYKGEVNDSRIDQMYQKIETYCEENVGVGNVPVVFMWAEDEEDLIMVYDSDAFENAKNSSSFVASRGNVPTFSDENERLQWTDDVFEAGSIKELSPYFTSQKGPLLISYSFQRYGGYVKVGVNKDTPERVNDSSINEIYQIVYNHYEEVGITDIPVVFVWEEVPQIDEMAIGEPPIEYHSEDTNVSDNEESSQTTPGFTSVMLVMCILILARFRK